MKSTLGLVALLTLLGACSQTGVPATDNAQEPVTPSGCEIDVPNAPPGVDCTDDE